MCVRERKSEWETERDRQIDDLCVNESPQKKRWNKVKVFIYKE